MPMVNIPMENFLNSSQDYGSSFSIGTLHGPSDFVLFATLNRKIFRDVPLEMFNNLVYSVATLLVNNGYRRGQVDVVVLARQDAPYVIEVE